ncbi:MAG: hypothetical protein AAF502_22615 [Bacteroidota bacterium]
MRKLNKVIESLNKQEARNFKIYANRIKVENRSKKIVTLFDAFKTKKYPSEAGIHENLFPDLNKNAFYRLKNRLLDEIDQSLLLLYSDIDEKTAIYKLLILAKISYHKNDYQSTFDLLMEAEKKALSSEYYDLLENIYNEVIQLSPYFSEINPRAYIEKKDEIQKQIQPLNELEHLTAEISYDLRTKNYGGKDKDATQILKNINEKLKNNAFITNSPQAKLKIHTVIRTILHQEKKFEPLKEYLISSLNSFEKDNVFTKSSHEEKIRLLIWLINTLQKTRTLKLSLHYAQQLYQELLKYNKLYFDKYKWSYYQIIFASHYYNDEVDKSIEILTTFQEEYFENFRIKDIADLPFNLIVIFQLNLTIAYYSKDEINNAQEHLTPFFYSDIFKKMSPQWKLNIFIVDILIHYETEDIEYILSRVKEVKRSQRNLLRLPDYAREKEFLNIIQKLMSLPAPLTNAKLMERIEAFSQESPPFEPGSNEAINYQIWLESRVKKQSYFETLLDYFS